MAICGKLEKGWPRLPVCYSLFICLGLGTILYHFLPIAGGKNSFTPLTLEETTMPHETLLSRPREVRPITASSDTLETVIERAKAINKLGKPVMVNVFNNGFLTMTLNWLCHTEPMNIHQHVLLVTLDVNTTNAIRAAGFLQVNIVTLTSNLPSEVKGATSYGKVGYQRLLYTRSKVITSLLQAGVELIQFESDATWFVNPFPFTLHFAGLNGVPADLVAFAVSDRPNSVATGYMYLRPSPSIIAIFTQLDTEMKKGVEMHRNRTDKAASIDPKLYDQPLISKIIMSFKDRVLYRLVPWDLAPDGKWYDKPEMQKRTKPLMLSNNWVVGNDNKIKRAKVFGHWFLDDHAVCRGEQARAFVQKNGQQCTSFCP